MSTTEKIKLDLPEVLDKFATKLGIASDRVFEILVRQAKLDFYISLIQFVCTLLFYFLISFAWNWVHPQQKGREWPGEVQVYTMFIIIGFFIWLIVSIIQLFDIIKLMLTNLINPKAAALDKILNALKN